MAKHPKAAALLTHGQIWSALDRLAARAGLSPSALARNAGLDPTTFNKSKRITADGRERWPSTESVAKALAATNVSIETFVQLISDGTQPAAVSVPLLGLTAASQRENFDENGYPTGTGWDETTLPAINDEHAFAVEISGEACAPLYRDGDVVLVSPATAIRRGDRVVVKPREGEIMIGELKRRTAKTLEISQFGAASGDRTMTAAEVAWIARIVWVRQ